MLRQPRRRRLLEIGVILLIVCGIVATGTALLQRDPAPHAPPPVGQAIEVDVHQTAAQSGDPLRRSSADVAPAVATDDLDIAVDLGATQQVVRGFGAAMTHSSAELLAMMPDDARHDLLLELFSPDGPVRLSTLRVPVGASDFIPGQPFTFDDVGEGETDWELDRFDLAPDREHLLPILQQVMAINPDLSIIASPWSPPAWLKTSRSLEGGRLLDEDRAYATYAEYLVRFVEGYEEAGVRVQYLTVQNEPQFRHPDGYPGTDMPYWQAAKLIDQLGPRLRQRGLATEILGFDHNWELSPGDAASTPAGEDPAFQYATDLLRSDASEWIAGTAFHCYYGDPAAMSRLWEQFPDQQLWVTECSGSHAADTPPDQVFADSLAWQSEHLMIASLRNRASAVLTWNLALDPTGGPHHGGCSTCTGVVTIGGDASVIRNAEYAVLAHVARFVPVGSTRVDSTLSDLPNVAFRTPTGRTVVVIWNPSDASRPTVVGDGQATVHVEVAARSLATVSWGREG